LKGRERKKVFTKGPVFAYVYQSVMSVPKSVIDMVPYDVTKDEKNATWN